MRKHRIIRNEIIRGPQTFLMDIETLDYERLLVSWACTSDSVTPGLALVCGATSDKNALPAASNFPGVPNSPAPGYVEYYSIGPAMICPISIPAMVTVGAVVPANVTVTVKIEGDYSESLAEILNATKGRS